MASWYFYERAVGFDHRVEDLIEFTARTSIKATVEAFGRRCLLEPISWHFKSKLRHDMRGRLTWIQRPSAAGDDPTLEAAGPPASWPGDPMLSFRDEFIFLLQTASEIEHALMVQYLYSAWSIPRSNPWRRQVMTVAKQEMGHLITIQNILRSLHAPLTLDRDEYPFRSQLYPFEFKLEPLSLHSLAKYVLAEMPPDPGIPAGQLNAIKASAEMGGVSVVNRVGDLFDRLGHLVRENLSDADFSPSTAPMQAHADGWRADSSNGVIVLTIATKADALEALRQIGEQGEGNDMPAPGDPESHFDVFLRIYGEREAATDDPATPVPSDPNTSPEDFASGDEEQKLASGRITHPRARLWALMSNLRYRILLTNIQHSISLPTDLDGVENELRDQSFDEMFRLGQLSGVLTVLPRGDEADAARAAVPFEMPYSLNFPDNELGRWLLHRDLVRTSQGLARLLENAGTDAFPNEKRLLDEIKGDDAARALAIDAQLTGLWPAGEGPVATIEKLWLLPSIAIARFGSSPEPMDNYDLGSSDAQGWRPLEGAETLRVDPVSGQVTGVSTPGSVNFRDSGGLVRPVSPFIEVWAQFEAGGEIRPLTMLHLQQLGLDLSALRWQVRAANHKASRRTGDDDDQINADTGKFSDHQPQPITGRSPNFKVNRSISFGSARYIVPTAQFPGLRLRFTPGHGLVFGPNASDPNISEDVYDSTRGSWDGHQDGAPGTPRFTSPGGIYAQDSGGRSLGYLDDACDGIVTVELNVPGAAVALTASARIASGPPHYSPDTLPVRTVADELEQMLLGTELNDATPVDAQQLGEHAANIIRRALGTVRMMNTDAMNVSGMAGHDTRFGRAGEAIFEPRSRAAYAAVDERHADVLAALDGLAASPGSPGRIAAVGALSLMAQMLREFDQVGDLTDAGRRRMPAMMRGADGLHLALTRRQQNTVRKAEELLQSQTLPTTPEDQMLALVSNFSSNANRHRRIDVGGGDTLDQLFGDPPQVLAFLLSGAVQGDSAPPALVGQPFIVPGNPDSSAFVLLLESPDHPMNSRFSTPIPSIGNKTGLQVVREWIVSLGGGGIA